MVDSPASLEKRPLEPVAFTTQIECGQGVVEVVDDDRLRIVPTSESLQTETELLVSGYNLCLQLTNRNGRERVLHIDVDLSGWFPEDWCRLPFRLPYWRRDSGRLEWREADPGQFNSQQGVHLELPLGADESTIISTIPHYPYTDCCRDLRRVLRHDPGLGRVVEIGRSVESRPILALELGPQHAARRVVLVGSQRPAEPSAWGLLAMAEMLVENPGARELLKTTRVCLAPQPNPDGVVHGRCFGNGAGVPIPQDWTKPAAERTVEGQALWKYLAAEPPVLVGQFDFAPATTRLSDWPRPLTVDIYNPVSVELHARLGAMSGETGLFPRDRRDPAILQLTHHAAKEWKCPVFHYRFVGPITSPERSRRRACLVLQTALDVIARRGS